jgi:subtilisin family serine protease
MILCRSASSVILGVLTAACAAGPRPAAPPPPAGASTAGTAAPAPADAVVATRATPIAPPAEAFVSGLMPLSSTGVDRFQLAHPTYDGRGVLIGILDSGVDPGVEGLIVTSEGAPKILDLRDFSGEGRIALSPVTPTGDTVKVGGTPLRGAGRIARLATGTAWYAGVFRELPLGKLPAADVNGDGDNTDAFPVVVVKAVDGWVVYLDSNLNGSFEDEQPLHDYRQGRQTIALGTKPLTLAANFAEERGVPVLDLIFDTYGHGTHVAGIAAGHNLYAIAGFDGVAPGAQLLGLKIANDARGGITVHGSVQRALDYAARFAAERNLPLVLSMSFGVGNELEGRAVMDSIVNEFLRGHPDILFTISAGNDGPGLSTMGFPASADLALAVGALFPGQFLRRPSASLPPAPDVLAWFSSRGAETAKPDVVAPGVAYSTVPRWNTGEEEKAGTSMAAPHVAGMAARLISGLGQENRRVSAADLGQALRVSAVEVAGSSVLDDGAGVPQLERAYRWLRAARQGSAYVVRAGDGSAAFRRDGLLGPGDTLQLFHVRHAGGLRAAEFTLSSDVPWLNAPAAITPGPLTTEIPVVYNAAALVGPGVFTGSVIARNPSDTLAGPLFELVNTVVIPYDLAAKPLEDLRRVIAPAQVRRYFLRASTPGSTLGVTVSIPDSLSQRALVKLYEPNGQPFRDLGDADVPVGEGGDGTVRLQVRAEDFVPGVYELDVVAPALAGVTATVRAAQAPVALTAAPGGLEATNPGSASAPLRAGTTLVGAERRVEVNGRGLPTESLTVRVPSWAASAEIDVAMPREQWGWFTDFGVTVYDSSGQQVSTEPQNYAVGRQHISVKKEMAGQSWTIELFPAFARAGASPAWHATIQVRFLLEAPRPLGTPSDVSVVAGGRAVVPVAAPPPPSALTLPERFLPLLEVTAVPTTGGGPAAVRREPPP